MYIRDYRKEENKGFLIEKIRYLIEVFVYSVGFKKGSRNTLNYFSQKNN